MTYSDITSIKQTTHCAYQEGWLKEKHVLMWKGHTEWKPFPLEKFKHISGVATRLFTETIEGCPTVVMGLPRYFMNGNASFSCFYSEFKSRYELEKVSRLKALLEALTKINCSVKDGAFIFWDYAMNEPYIPETELEEGDVEYNLTFLKNFNNGFVEDVEAKLKQAIEEKKADPMTPQELDEALGIPIGRLNAVLKVGKEVAKGSYKSISKAVLISPGQDVVPCAFTTYVRGSINGNKENFETYKTLSGKEGVIKLLHPSLIFTQSFLTPLYDMTLCWGALETTFLNRMERVEVLRQAALGLSSIHNAGWIYCDMKPDNVLLKKTAKGIEAVLADLDGAVQKDSGKRGVITPLWISPEWAKLDKENKRECPTTKHDSWSFAMMLVAVLYHRLPGKYFLEHYVACPTEQRWEAWRRDASSAATWYPPTTLKSLVEKGLSLDPEKRPEADEYLSELAKVKEEMISC